MSMKIGRLAQENVYGVQATDTIDFITQDQVPTNNKVTYAQCVCDHRPLKPESNRVRIVVGGDKVDCTIDSGSPTTNVAEFKILLNSIISDAKHSVRLLGLDLKVFLASPMKIPKYMKMKYSLFPPDIIKNYGLAMKVVPDGYIC